MLMFRLSLSVSHSDGLMIPAQNFPDDLAMALKMPVKFMSRLNGFSLSVYILAFENIKIAIYKEY